MLHRSQNQVAFILRNHDVLLEEFHQLMSFSASKEKNPKTSKSDLDRMVEFLMKVKDLVNGIHGALLSAIEFNSGDSQGLIKRLNVIFRDHTSLKDEFISFMVDFGLLEEPKHGLECMNITPSYSIRTKAKKKSTSCNGILNERYVSKGEFDQSRVKEKRVSLSQRRMNDLEDKLLKEDMYFLALTSVVEFGNRVFSNKELNEKPPVGFNEVVRRFYEDMGKIVPPSFRKDPKRAVQGILVSLQDLNEKMYKAKEHRLRKIYQKEQQKNNVYKSEVCFVSSVFTSV